MAPAPTYWHQELILRLALELKSWARTRSEPVCLGLSPLDLRFGPGRILQPDLFVVFGETSLDQAGPITRIPEVCIEVLSTDGA